MTVKTSISLSESQADYARDLVECGLFPSLSAVAQHGIEMIRQKQEAEQADIQALKSLLQERLEGAFVGSETFRSRVSKMLDKNLQAYDLED